MTEEKFKELSNEYFGLNISELPIEATKLYEFVKFCAEAHLKDFKRKSRENAVVVFGAGKMTIPDIIEHTIRLMRDQGVTIIENHEEENNGIKILNELAPNLKEKTFTLTKLPELPELKPYVDDQFSRKKYPNTGGPLGAIEKKRKY